MEGLGIAGGVSPPGEDIQAAGGVVTDARMGGVTPMSGGCRKGSGVEPTMSPRCRSPRPATSGIARSTAALIWSARDNAGRASGSGSAI